LFVFINFSSFKPFVCVRQGQGTIRPYAAFNAEQDSQALRKAMKGFGEFTVYRTEF